MVCRDGDVRDQAPAIVGVQRCKEKIEQDEKFFLVSNAFKALVSGGYGTCCAIITMEGIYNILSPSEYWKS